MRSLIAIIISALAMYSCTSATGENAKTSEMTVSETKAAPLRHVVLFKFKDESTPEDVERIEKAFEALPGQIPEIIDFEWGTNNSPEGLDQGFTHCFFVTFASEEGRATYLPHPKHKVFIDIASPHIDKVLVVDYWAQ